MNARGIARLGILAVGLGIGAAVASPPGVAWADDLQISIDGYDLFPTAGNTAVAYSGTGDIAIAYGDGAVASAQGGTGDFALAGGSDALAASGGLSYDTGADDDLLSTYATNGSYLYDILSPAGDLPGSAAATSGGFLAELLSVF